MSVIIHLLCLLQVRSKNERVEQAGAHADETRQSRRRRAG